MLSLPCQNISVIMRREKLLKKDGKLLKKTSENLKPGWLIAPGKKLPGLNSGRGTCISNNKSTLSGQAEGQDFKTAPRSGARQLNLKIEHNFKHHDKSSRNKNHRQDKRSRSDPGYFIPARKCYNNPIGFS